LPASGVASQAAQAASRRDPGIEAAAVLGCHRWIRLPGKRPDKSEGASGALWRQWQSLVHGNVIKIILPFVAPLASSCTMWFLPRLLLLYWREDRGSGFAWYVLDRVSGCWFFLSFFLSFFVFLTVWEIECGRFYGTKKWRASSRMYLWM